MANLLKVMADVGTNEDSKGVRLVIPVDPGRPLMMTSCTTEERIDATGVLMSVNLRAGTLAKETNLANQNTENLVAIAEKVLTARYLKRGSDEYLAIIDQAIQDAEHVLVERMGYEQIDKTDFDSCPGWRWPAGLPDRSSQPKAYVDAMRLSHANVVADAQDADALGESADGDTSSEKGDPPEDDNDTSQQVKASAIGLPAKRGGSETRIARTKFKCGFEINREYNLEVRDAEDRPLSPASERRCVEIKSKSIVFATSDGKSWLYLEGGETYWRDGETLIVAYQDGGTCRYTPLSAAYPTAEESTPPPTRSSPPLAPSAEIKLVSVRSLRNDSSKHAPNSGSVCAGCHVNVNRAQFRPSDQWSVVEGSAYCSKCPNGKG